MRIKRKLFKNSRFNAMDFYLEKIGDGDSYHADEMLEMLELKKPAYILTYVSASCIEIGIPIQTQKQLDLLCELLADVGKI